MAASLPIHFQWSGSDVEDEAAGMADYAKRKHSKGSIDKAGLALIDWLGTPAGTPLADSHWQVFENWRNCHGLPLTRVRRDLQTRMKVNDVKGIVVYRLKRFVSTVLKLQREPTMKLSQMQDLGGCRAIVGSIGDVRKLLASYRSESLTGYVSHRTVKFDNYLDQPKADGYRGVHVVCRFSSPSSNYEPWEGQRIEVQVRTKLQHAFATAVETVTTFDSTPLKFGGGTAEWRRFFALVGSAFAAKEDTAPIPGTPAGGELQEQIRRLAKRLRVRRKLETWRKMVKALPRIETEAFQWLLLQLDLGRSALSVTGFADYTSAREALAARERIISEAISEAEGAREDVVLVSLNSLPELKKAYPNYYGDTRRFLQALNEVTARRRL